MKKASLMLLIFLAITSIGFTRCYDIHLKNGSIIEGVEYQLEEVFGTQYIVYNHSGSSVISRVERRAVARIVKADCGNSIPTPIAMVNSNLIKKTVEAATSALLYAENAKIEYCPDKQTVAVSFDTVDSFDITSSEFYAPWRRNQWKVLQEFKKNDIPVKSVSVKTNFDDHSGYMETTTESMHIDLFANSESGDTWINFTTFDSVANTSKSPRSTPKLITPTPAHRPDTPTSRPPQRARRYEWTKVVSSGTGFIDEKDLDQLDNLLFSGDLVAAENFIQSARRSGRAISFRPGEEVYLVRRRVMKEYVLLRKRGDTREYWTYRRIVDE